MISWSKLIDLRLKYERGEMTEGEIIDFYRLLALAGWLDQMPNYYKVQARVFKREGYL